MALIDYIYNCYNSGALAFFNSDSCTTDGRKYNKNHAFQKFLTLDLTQDTLEIPCIYKYSIVAALKDYLTQANPPKILKIPIMVFQEFTDPCKTSESGLKVFFTQVHSGSLLASRVIKDTKYIGGEGLLFYEDMTPMAMMTLEITRVPGTCTYTPVRQIFRINPIVYKKSDILSKYIRSNLLTKLLDMHVDWGTPLDDIHVSWYNRKKVLKDTHRIFTNRKLSWDFKVIVDDFSFFFDKPTVPDCNFSNDSINDFLESEESSIIKLIGI